MDDEIRQAHVEDLLGTMVGETFEVLEGGEASEVWEGLAEDLERSQEGTKGWKIRFGGPPEHHVEEADCPDCGRHLRSEGVRFALPPELEEQLASTHPLVVHIHWGDNCPALKHRWWRLWNRGPIWWLRVRTPGSKEWRLRRRWRKA